MPPAITSLYLGNLRVESTHLASKNKIITDAPTDNHGKGEAFSPTDLVCAALASCAMTIMAIKAQEMGKDLANTRMEIAKTMAKDPRCIAQIEVTFHIPGDFVEEQRRILERAAQTCPVCLSLGPETRQIFTFDWAG